MSEQNAADKGTTGGMLADLMVGTDAVEGKPVNRGTSDQSNVVLERFRAFVQAFKRQRLMSADAASWQGLLNDQVNALMSLGHMIEGIPTEFEAKAVVPKHVPLNLDLAASIPDNLTVVHQGEIKDLQRALMSSYADQSLLQNSLYVGPNGKLAVSESGLKATADSHQISSLAVRSGALPPPCLSVHDVQEYRMRHSKYNSFLEELQEMSAADARDVIVELQDRHRPLRRLARRRMERGAPVADEALYYTKRWRGIEEAAKPQLATLIADAHELNKDLVLIKGSSTGKPGV